MSRPTVYVALQQFCEADDRPRRLLLEAGYQLRRNTLGRRPRQEDLRDALPEVDAVLAGVEPYEAALLGALPRLRCISRCGVGTDAIDLDAARRLGIAVYTTQDEVVEPVAQLTVAMILALARNLAIHLRDAAAGRWTKRTGVLLSEWVIGLVGFGRIGRRVFECLQPFAPRVLAHDPRLSARDLPPGVELRDLPSLLRDADVVSLHAGRPAAEGAVLGGRELALMKPGSVLVNTARGFLVDEAALEEALRSGRLAGAALDVFHEEPYAGPLAGLPNVLCTPHVATLTRSSRARMELAAAQHIVDHFVPAQRQAPARGRAAVGAMR